MDKNYDIMTFVTKFFILKRSRVAIFAAIIKIIARFIKTQKKLRKLEIIY